MERTILTQLERAFPSYQVKKRQGPGGKMLDYVETQIVIKRLNNVFDGEWDFDVLEWKELGTEIVVLGRLTAQGRHKDQFGSNQITIRNDVPIDSGNTLKAAASDSLKKCASCFGIGINLYIDSDILEIDIEQQMIVCEMLDEYGKSIKEFNVVLPKLIKRKDAVLENLNMEELQQVVEYLRKKINEKENEENGIHDSAPDESEE